MNQELGVIDDQAIHVIFYNVLTSFVLNLIAVNQVHLVGENAEARMNEIKEKYAIAIKTKSQPEIKSEDILGAGIVKLIAEGAMAGSGLIEKQAAEYFELKS